MLGWPLLGLLKSLLGVLHAAPSMPRINAEAAESDPADEHCNG